MPSFSNDLQHIKQLCDAGNSEAIATWSLQCAKAEISQCSQAFVYIETYLAKHSHELKNSFDCADALRPMHNLTIEKLFSLLHPDESLNAKHNHVINNAILALLKSEATVYQTLLKQALQQNLDNETKATVLHRALATQLNALLSRYKLKLPIPAQYWRNFHKFFALANQSNLMSFRFCDGTIAWDQRFSIENLYCMALLIDSANLNQLNNAKIDSCFDILCESIDLVGLSINASHEENDIVVDISSSTGPHFKNLEHNNESHGVLIYLKIHELIHKMQRLQNSQSNFIAPLYQHLHNAWSQSIHREVREHVEENLIVCLDFEDMHYYLCGHQKLEAFIGEKATLSIHYDENENEEAIRQMEGSRSQNIYGSGLVESKGDLVFDTLPEHVHLQQLFSAQTDHTERPNTCQAIRIDKSQKGCRLLWQGDNIPVIDIGTLLTILTDKNSNEWQLAEVVWIHHKDANSIETGIRIMSMHPIPVAIDVPLKACMHVNFLPALLLPPNQSFAQKTRLLVGRHGFEKGDQANITQGHQEQSIKLNRLLHQYVHYNLFECGFYTMDNNTQH